MMREMCQLHLCHHDSRFTTHKHKRGLTAGLAGALWVRGTIDNEASWKLLLLLLSRLQGMDLRARLLRCIGLEMGCTCAVSAFG